MQGILPGYGHVSARNPDNPNHYFLSRSLAPELVTADDIVEFDLDSNAVDGKKTAFYLERFIHGEIYKARPDVQAIVHNHSPGVIAFGAGSTPLRPVTHDSSFLLGGVPIWDYRDFGTKNGALVDTPDRGRALAKTLANRPVVLMRNHGVAIVARSLPAVVENSVSLEKNAQILNTLLARGDKITYLELDESLARSGHLGSRRRARVGALEETGLHAEPLRGAFVAIKRTNWAAGRLVTLEHTSRVLADNPLGDPHVRLLDVWLPPQYDRAKGRGRGARFPVVYDLVGFTGTGRMHTAPRSFEENVPERAARLVHERKMGPMIVAFPDCFTALGGNQYVNSTAIGRYADYLTRELVPFVDKEFRTLALARAPRLLRQVVGRLRRDPARHEVLAHVGRGRVSLGRLVFRLGVRRGLAEHARRAREVPAAEAQAG